MDGQYKEPYTKFIVADVNNNILDKEMLEAMREDLATRPQTDPKYLASLDEAIKMLLGPEDIVKRERDRE